MLTDDKLRAAIAYNVARDYPDDVADATFAHVVHSAQVNAGLDPDGKLGTLSLREFERPAIVGLDYATIFAGWVQPMPVTSDGVKPRLTSGFIARSGRGPNKHRLKNTGRPHYGGDLAYWWDGEGNPPAGWRNHHFDGRQERRFYCPPVEIRSMGPGVVKYAKLLDVDEIYGGPRWSVKIYHGVLPGFGHCMTWSVHHSSVTVRKGDDVVAGQPIAIAGESGTEGAPHNHQELWRWQDGERFDRETGAMDLAPILPHLELRAA